MSDEREGVWLKGWSLLTSDAGMVRLDLGRIALDLTWPDALDLAGGLAVAAGEAGCRVGATPETLEEAATASMARVREAWKP